jgi:tyrosinase
MVRLIFHSNNIRATEEQRRPWKYVTWTPARLTVVSADGAAKRVRLENHDPTIGGQVRFLPSPDGTPADSIELDVPATTPNRPDAVQCWIAGRYDDTASGAKGFPSTTDGDAAIRVTDVSSGSVITTEPFMVRIRKNANDLTPTERDRFLTALLTLNQRGAFVDFQNMHTVDTSLEIHSRSCFLPWHRLYLLDLERKLQAIDPSVTLPYWKFDEPAGNVFVRDFLGVPDQLGIVQFSSSNPLVNWRLTVFGDGSGRIVRMPQPGFDPATEAAPISNDETATLDLGTTPGPTPATTRVTFERFERMEGDPHGAAHSSFEGQVAAIGRAPADPLFFLLHANVDRLWAKWQWLHDRADPDDSRSYHKQGAGPANPDPRRANADRIGNYLDDALWPWSGLVGDPRPRTAPGTYFPASPFIAVPGRYPLLRQAIDFQGQRELGANLGFGYDDIRFEFE